MGTKAELVDRFIYRKTIPKNNTKKDKILKKKQKEIPTFKLWNPYLVVNNKLFIFIMNKDIIYICIHIYNYIYINIYIYLFLYIYVYRYIYI